MNLLSKNLSFALSACAITALLSTGAMADEHKTLDHPLAKKHPSTYTCEDLLLTAVEYVPEIVYWHDGYNTKTKVMTETLDEDWTPVVVSDVLTECAKTPKKALTDVVKHNRASKAAATK